MDVDSEGRHLDVASPVGVEEREVDAMGEREAAAGVKFIVGAEIKAVVDG